MTGAEHYREAEKLLALDERIREGGGDPGDILHAAQVHATLALAAATALPAPVQDELAGFTTEEWDAWFAAAGTRPGGGRR